MAKKPVLCTSPPFNTGRVMSRSYPLAPTNDGRVSCPSGSQRDYTLTRAPSPHYGLHEGLLLATCSTGYGVNPCGGVYTEYSSSWEDEHSSQNIVDGAYLLIGRS